MRIVAKFTNNLLIGLYTSLVLVGVSSLWDIGVTKARWTFYPLPFSNDLGSGFTAPGQSFQPLYVSKEFATICFVGMILAALLLRRRMLGLVCRRTFWLSSGLVLIGVCVLSMLALCKNGTYFSYIPVLGYIPKNIIGDVGSLFASLGLFISWVV